MKESPTSKNAFIMEPLIVEADRPSLLLTPEDRNWAAWEKERKSHLFRKGFLFCLPTLEKKKFDFFHIEELSLYSEWVGLSNLKNQLPV